MVTQILAFANALKKVGEMTTAEAGSWFRWAIENPKSGAVAADMLAGFADHRHYLLKGRKFVFFRKAHRLRRLESVAGEMRELASKLRELTRMSS